MLSKHIQNVRKILQQLKEFNLQIKPKKYKFYIMEVKFLEYILIGTEIYIDNNKVKAVRD